MKFPGFNNYVVTEQKWKTMCENSDQLTAECEGKELFRLYGNTRIFADDDKSHGFPNCPKF